MYWMITYLLNKQKKQIIIEAPNMTQAKKDLRLWIGDETSNISIIDVYKVVSE